MRLSIFRCSILLCASAFVGGCYNPNTGGIADPPSRLGSMPFPGLYTLYHQADSHDLGTHSYEGGLIHGAASEESRGTLYTCHGGFIDIAHLRKPADLTRHAAFYVEKALRHGDTSFLLKGKEPSIYHISINYPPGWSSIDPAQKDKLITEASIRMGQRLAILQTTWHEIMTWFGYVSFILPEKTSAFSYDDMYSHVVGAYVGGHALRDTTRDYNAAVTHQLELELDMLGRVSNEQCKQAIEAVRNKWWTPGIGRQRKRYLHNIFQTGAVTPWLVPDIDFCPNAEPHVYKLPTLDDVHGHDLSNLFHVEIDPRFMSAGGIRRLFDPKPKLIDPEKHFPTIFAEIKRQMQKDFGEDVVDPALDFTH